MNAEQTIQTAIAFLQERFESLLGVYVFGSFASGRQRQDSDLDLAILANAPIEKQLLWQVQTDLAVKIKRDVDLVDLRKAPEVLAFEIVNKGKRVYCSDRDACSEAELLAYTLYTTLQYHRMPIIKKIQQRGSTRHG